METPRYTVTYTREAEQIAAGLTTERRALLERGCRMLALDPYGKASRPHGPEEHTRRAILADGMMIVYVISGAYMIVVVLDVFDITGYLTDDACDGTV